jgi:hypothetical protein
VIDEERFEELCGHLERLAVQLDPHQGAGEIMPLHFNGAEGKVEHVDQRGLEIARSYGIYNPLAIKAYLALGSAEANEAAGALAIPAESALILPLVLVGWVRVGVDAKELGNEAALIWRLKFATPQPFFLGGL